jgi:hypothetical protein
MRLKDELLALEDKLWRGGPDAYREHLDEECLIAFTGMAGVMGREEIAGTVEEGDRWRDVRIDTRGLVQPTESTAILTYEARAVRGEGETYHALVSSAYAKREGSWKMVFHQQTPLAGE